MPEAVGPAILLNVVVFVAAIFQTVTGVGFALIAGPFLLIVIDSSSAVQTNILLNLMMASILAPLLARHQSRPHLKELALGSVLGLPLGVCLFLWTSLTVLKLGAGVLIGITIALSFWRPKRSVAKAGAWAGIATGVVSGAMTGFAAMPGPAASLYLTSFRGLLRDSARSTIFAFFFLTYAAALAAHWLVAGLQQPAVVAALSLAPMTVAGIAVGCILAPRVDQKYFKVAITAVLVVTAASLIASAVLAHR